MGAFAVATALAALPLARGSEDVFPVGLRVAIVGLLALVAALVLAQAWLVTTSLLLLGGLYAPISRWTTPRSTSPPCSSPPECW